MLESSENGQPLIDIVLQFFQQDQWNYQKTKNPSIIRAGFHGERGTWICYARVDEANRRFLFHSWMGLSIPAGIHPAVLEYLNRVNCRLPIGSFDLNQDTGDVRCKTGVEDPGGTINVGLVRALAYANVRAMDQYFPGVVAVVHSGLSPLAALARLDAGVFQEETFG